MASNTVQWEFELKKDTWIRFDDELIATLNEHWQDGVFQTEYKGARLEFDFSDMRHKNCDSGYQRNIRCVFINADGDHVAWEYANRRRRYVAFLPNLLPKLEDAYGDKSELQVEVENINFEVDFENSVLMSTQKRLARNFRRVISNAAPGDTLPVPTREASERIRKKRQEAEEEAAKAGPVDMALIHKKRDKRSEDEKLMDPDDEPAVPPKPKVRKVAEASLEEEIKKKVVIKGSAPVDPECTEKVANSHVYCEGNNIYDAMLNQTNIQNNNNKFFLIQLLEDDNVKRYSVWFRWGRVGFRGQTNLQGCGNDLEKAKSIFCNKFLDKTKNNWAERDNFEKVTGKYDLIKMDYAKLDEDKEKAENAKEDAVEPEPSKLDERVQALLQLICDIRTMEEAVLEMEYDARRAPLGKVTKQQIKAGYEALQRIEQFIGTSKFNKDFVDAVNDYYTRIPHAFGMRQPPLIKTKEALKKEMDLLDVLSDIEVAVRKLNEGAGELSSKVNPIDRHYESMRCGLSPLEQSTSEYQMVERYLENTHAPTHSSYKMKIRNVFAVDKHGEKEKLNSSVGNRKLLWHGSRLANWYGILSQGLRIAPPEAPVTGYMFGKGVYFADMSSKSANYCFPQPGKPGFLLLAEVLLGETNDLINSDYNASKLPKGKSSTFGMGRIAPDPAEDLTLPDGCVVPLGKPIEMEGAAKYTLNYNEYIVYNTNQINLKYLVEVDFDFESLL